MAQLRWHVEPQHPTGVLFDPDVERIHGRGVFAGMEFLHVRAKSIINRLPKPMGLPFDYTINAYRGCSHACVYCFARPTHEYLGLGPGEDFDRRIVVKVNAVELLRAELHPRRWAGHPIAMGTNTDPYQRCEGKYRLTRGVIEALTEFSNPFSILTKSTLVLRDLELLVRAAAVTDVGVNLSIGTLDPDVWRLTEPGTPHPQQRLRAVAALNEAGVACGVLVAPVIPGLSDRTEQLEAIGRACREAGAVTVAATVLHLRPGVKEHYLAEMSRLAPSLAADHRRRFRRGASVPSADRERVASIVRRAAGLDQLHEFRRAPPPPPVAATTQLRLELARNDD